MRNRIILFIAALLCSASGQSQDFYTGKFRVIGPNAENAAIYTNVLSIAINRGTEVSISLHFRGGSRTEPDDYINLSGTINGSIQGGRLDASGSVAAELKDGSRLTQDQQGMTFTGTLNANKIEGKVYLGPVNEGAFFAFTATSSELKPALTFPVGPSPMVFNKGWVFGANFSITDEEGNEIDLSDKVEWSGTATFNPAKGKTSHPSFNTIGSNKIILTVKYEDKTYKEEYKIITVDVTKYAFQGCIAFAAADGHGCPACPHPTVGPILMGSPEVLIEGYPAARVGDMGTHAACCDGNYYTITTGDDNVLINGRAAALFQFSQTKHCGSTGFVGNATQRNYI
ncbi:MAG TPA: PAAR domain-containing protein, partial [Chitinophagaceae bacterium]|nr:PAAR domain-containing protein [Chitinophagaceae bacterium]